MAGIPTSTNHHRVYLPILALVVVAAEAETVFVIEIPDTPMIVERMNGEAEATLEVLADVAVARHIEVWMMLMIDHIALILAQAIVTTTLQVERMASEILTTDKALC